MVYADSHAHLVDYSPEQLEKVLELMSLKQVNIALSERQSGFFRRYHPFGSSP